jgi:hypothetical protein
MLQYLQGVANAGPPPNAQLYTMQVAAPLLIRRCAVGSTCVGAQALWQQNSASTAIGELEGSSLLLDEVKSQLHVLLEQWISSKQLNSSAINMLEVSRFFRLLADRFFAAGHIGFG